MRALATRQAVLNEELSILDAGGDSIVVLSSATPIIQDGELTGGVVTLRDITDRKRIEEQKDEFISVASHELKTPVTSMKLNAQRLLRQALKRKAPQDEVAGLESIGRQADKMTRLVRNLLDVSRLESGQLAVNLKPLKLARFVPDVMERLSLTAEGRELVLAGSADYEVMADPDRLEQVLINLVANAVQHSPAGSRIMLIVAPGHGRVVMGVRDEGEGIERTKQVHLFERFYQVNPSHSQGAGLGLFIAKELILQHHGTIWVSSVRGEGSTFYFSLPTELAASLPARPNVKIKR
jgi:signal transduction histidine kinase